MIYPSIDKLLLFVDSKYRLVHIAAQRSDQINQTKHLQKGEKCYKSAKNIGKALEEVAEGLVIMNKK